MKKKRKHIQKSPQELLRDKMGEARVKEFKRVCDNVIPCVYASIAIALYNRGRRGSINSLFKEAEQIWSDYANNPGDITDMCFKLTGIDVRSQNAELHDYSERDKMYE